MFAYARIKLDVGLQLLMKCLQLLLCRLRFLLLALQLSRVDWLLPKNFMLGLGLTARIVERFQLLFDLLQLPITAA